MPLRPDQGSHRRAAAAHDEKERVDDVQVRGGKQRRAQRSLACAENGERDRGHQAQSRRGEKQGRNRGAGGGGVGESGGGARGSKADGCERAGTGLLVLGQVRVRAGVRTGVRVGVKVRIKVRVSSSM